MRGSEVRNQEPNFWDAAVMWIGRTILTSCQAVVCVTSGDSMITHGIPSDLLKDSLLLVVLNLLSNQGQIPDLCTTEFLR
jgi:hypothetical protein